MEIHVLAGWLFPNDTLATWWNTHIAVKEEHKILPDESPSCELYSLLYDEYGGGASREGEYIAHPLYLGPAGKKIHYVFVPTESASFQGPPDDCMKCGLKPETERTFRVKRFLEEKGLNFEENGVRFYNYRYF